MAPQRLLSLLLFGVVVFGSNIGFAQSSTDLSYLLTAPERSSFEETTRYDEVMAFLRVASAQSPMLHLTTFGYTTEGRAMPLVVFGDVADATVESVRASGKMPIFVQGNIHAGEVCGKEALLMLIRDLAEGRHRNWADSLVILMAPIYNADGNERVNLFNRPRQNGPLAGMGQRPNAQGLDLNRDHMKVKSPEARSLLQVFNTYDPKVVVDLHTTNGTRHAYHVTYSPPLNPNTAPPIDTYLRKTWLPEMTETIRKRVGWEYYYYGNLPYRRGDPGWYTFDNRPRFNNNYVGLRNRMAILSEAYSYATFEERIMATLYFVEEILNHAADQRTAIEQVIATAEAIPLAGMDLGVRFQPSMNQESVEILMGDVETLRNPYSGSSYYERKDTVYTQTMPEWGAFEPTETARAPAHYVVSASAASVVGAYLDTHGVIYSSISEADERELEAFTIDSTTVSSREFQQIFERTLFGSSSSKWVAVEKGSLIVSTSQPLGRLVFYLLEPRSDDGLVNWAQLDKWLEPGKDYPIYRSID